MPLALPLQLRLQQCKDEAISPTTQLYGSAVHACSQHRQWRHAVKLVKEMKGVDCYKLSEESIEVPRWP